MPKDRILLVDNSPQDLQSWAAVLRSAGHDVQEASSEETGRRSLAQGDFDLAVVDLHLQEGGPVEDDSGLRIAEDFGRSLPIIILTGEPSLELQRRALRGGQRSPAIDFIYKRDGAPALLDAVRRAIRPKIFISHGHDDPVTTMVAKFLEDGGTKPILVQQQPRASHLILDAFEKNTNVAFAIVLMTPDDEGRAKGESAWQPRARQNVIFELGYLLAKLGRDRVLVLYKPEGVSLEWPSNFTGVLYREMGWGGAWRDDLRQDLYKAGIKLG